MITARRRLPQRRHEEEAGGVFNKEAFAGDFRHVEAVLHRQRLPRRQRQGSGAEPQPRLVGSSTSPSRSTRARSTALGKIRAKEVLGRGEGVYNENILADSINPVIKEGDVASMGKIQTIIQDIERRYKDAGHAYVNVIPDGRQDRENLKLCMTLEVGKGPLVLRRAHQHQRQRQDRRQGHPPRDGAARGRPLPPRAARSSPSST